MHRNHRSRTFTAIAVASGALALAGVTPLAGSPPAIAAGRPHVEHPRSAGDVPAAVRTPVPTATAQREGVTRAGGGYMGWEAHGSSTASPQAVSPKALTGPDAVAQPDTSVTGIDVSRYQGNVNWASYWKQGMRFAYVKATEGTYNRSAYFTQQYNGSYKQGFIRGAYHFANPEDSGGAAQATYFVEHGGGWSGDGKTLPGVLDIEYNPYGGTCYGKTKAAMVSWIASFLNRYKALTGRDAVIYTTTDWWKTCTGNTSKFHTTNPLWVARYASKAGTLPGNWPYYTFWQHTSTPLDQDYFNGTVTRLRALAKG